MNSEQKYEHNNAGGVDLQKLRSGFKRRRKIFAIALALGLVATMLALVLIPATYLSKSTILIEQQEIPAELVRSTVTSYADQRIETITQRVMTTKNLWDIVEKYDLYPELREKETRQHILELMRDKGINRNIISAEVVDPRSGRPTEATIAFQLSFKYENPQLAQRVANELTTLFLSENLKTRTEMAGQAESFLTTEAQKLNTRVLQLEQDLAEFKERNFDSLPELVDLNIRMLDRTEQALRENELARNSVRERLVFIESQLAQTEPNASIVSGHGERLLSSAARLKFTKQQYEQALARYSEAHPEVQRLYKEMTGLMGDVPDQDAPRLKLEIFQLQLTQAQARYSDEHPTVQNLQQAVARVGALAASDRSGDTSASENADNPAWLQLKAQFETAQLEMESYNQREALLKADLKKYETRITDAPRIEQTYQQLSRDYQSAVLKYAEIRAKQQEASLGQSLESEQKGERFTLIEPPLVPEEPHSPNRKLIGVLGLFLSLGLAVGLVLLREMMDKSIRGRKALINAMGAAPLAIIPLIVTPDENATARRNVWLAILFGALVTVALLGVFHVFVKPLDVTWYLALRKFGWM
jgi:uncharacterized protein involved in exopolysaccharide biosynthesis